MKYCPHCGRLINANALVCPYCGYQQSRITRDQQPRSNQYSDRDRQGQFDPNPDRVQLRDGRGPGHVKYSKAKLSGLDIITLIINVLNAGTLFFLGFQGLLRPFYINNTGTFVTVILSLFGIVALCFEVRQNHKNRLPIWSALVALAGDVSVFVMIFMFNQRILLISLAILVIAMLLFDRELKRTY